MGMWKDETEKQQTQELTECQHKASDLTDVAEEASEEANNKGC